MIVYVCTDTNIRTQIQCTNQIEESQMSHQTKASSPAKKTPKVAAAGTKQWVLYLLECRNGSKTSFYSGITNDLHARFNAHVSGKGAKYTRANKPIRILASCAFADRPSASSAEWHLKQQPRARKLAFLQAMKPVLAPHIPIRSVKMTAKLTKKDKALLDLVATADAGMLNAAVADLTDHVQSMRSTIAGLKARLELATAVQPETPSRPRQRG